MSLKYLILVLLLIGFYHTFILSEKTRFGYPFVVPYLVFFVGVFCNAPYFCRLAVRGRRDGRPAGEKKTRTRQSRMRVLLGRGRRTRTLNKGFGDPRVTITPCPYGTI